MSSAHRNTFEIVEDCLKGLTVKQIAHKWNTSEQTIYAIRDRYTEIIRVRRKEPQRRVINTSKS